MNASRNLRNAVAVAKVRHQRQCVTYILMGDCVRDALVLQTFELFLEVK